ncbi:uncharacterized protein LOC133795555 [Humulus lupulus]|uniref:uncharacterized protein LOC133795555 n=1 Tax=Humulus lupulus TaxID=3486 RepID=UPI002B4044C5|nr:uncharacterized protein LOC133795555 [Humulus lupulus]
MSSFLHKPRSRLQRIVLAFLNTNANFTGRGRANVGAHGSPLTFLNSFSTLSPLTSSSFTTDSLKKTSLALSPELALAATQNIGRESKRKSDVDIALFRRYGFSSDQIAKIFTRSFQTLSVKTLEPKLQFLSDCGMSRENMVLVVSADPLILNRSLEKQISPCIRFLKSFYGGIDHVVSLFLVKRGTWVLHQFSEATAPNVETLRSHGVPDYNIAKMFVIRPQTLARNVDAFTDLVKEAKRLGFNISSLMFIHGMASLSGMRKGKWDSKMDIFKSFGWSEEQVRVLIVRQPQVMPTSEERMKLVLEFFTTKLQWGPIDFCKYPNVLLFSFEKSVRIL